MVDTKAPRRSISFRLRKIDADLAKAIDGIDSEALSELCRDGLRLILGIRTTRRVEVTERTIVPQDNVKKTVMTLPSKASVFIPQNKRSLHETVNDSTDTATDD